ncbi:MAG: hypothetical protein OJF59_001418 [Cytophagales bacterium]|jgi:hypothetical protein|nr:hypothetical protein [Bacteroidota bacterium]MBS1980353.1 hypothetical protein [Bacteroidota bacterium]WHZ07665.1 MAG: hypothetical protein OJF59_001418 [Cytophagales bacterium]
MIQLVEVLTDQDKAGFLYLPVTLYRDFPNWIRPLDKDIEGVFDQVKNKSFRTGECIRWIAKNDLGEVIGRVAAFYDKKHATKGNEQPTGGLGLFECINDRSVAFALFDQCKKWLQEKGMEAMDGPINFGNRDRWWGLLVKGYELEPNYQCNYNPPYYQDFFEAYGFQVYFYQLTFGRKIQGELAERMYKKANLTAQDNKYRFDYLRKKDWHTLADKIRTVYNQAWANRGEIPELTDVQAKAIVKQMKPIMDEALIWFGYYNNEPIAFLLALPEVNQIFKRLKGKLGLIGKLKFLWFTLLKSSKKAFGVLFGVVPAHQGKGVDGAIIESFQQFLLQHRKQYLDFELNWIADFNVRMIRVCEQINSVEVKRHATYRKLFDETKPFKRFPIKH